MQETTATQNTITVSLPDDIKGALDEAAREAGKSPSELICEALRDYLFIRKFRLLREHMTSKAQAQGIDTDQDVFERVS
jgi:predicted transcriptional regulator